MKRRDVRAFAWSSRGWVQTAVAGARLSAALTGLLTCGFVLLPAASAQKETGRYLRFHEVRGTLELNADSGLPGSEIRDEKSWDSWIREQDRKTRARVDRGIEDSISNLVFFGTSFTDLPRLDAAESAVSESGELKAGATARIEALEAALRSNGANGRVQLVRAFLRGKGISADSREYFAANLRRFAAEQAQYEQKLREAATNSDPSAVYLARGDLYEKRGLSVDTSLLPNFAIEETLRVMLAKEAVARSSVARVAIVGPGLDFADKREGYDYYPLQTLQPFAALDAVRRLGLAKDSGVEIACLDLNSAVVEHVSRLAADARAGHSYVVQLPREENAGWSPEAISYWEHFGDFVGSPLKPIPVPVTLEGVTSRAVRIRPALAARLEPYDADIVAQTLDFKPGSGFDLVIATNVLVYYDRVQQALAMANIARMMNAGGIFLANSVLPAQHVPELEYLGRRTTAYAADGTYGDDVVVYRRR